MEGKITNNLKNQHPKYQTEGAAGLDVCSKMSIDIQPGETKLIHTGLYVEIPEGYEIQIRPRSGLGYRDSIIILNSPGKIDANYRDEIRVILFNYGKKIFKITEGDKIAQLILAKIEQIKWDTIPGFSEITVNIPIFVNTSK